MKGVAIGPGGVPGGEPKKCVPPINQLCISIAIIDEVAESTGVSQPEMPG